MLDFREETWYHMDIFKRKKGKEKMKDNMVQGELFKNWEGHEMTESQYARCLAASEWLYDWDLQIPHGIEEKYERETGKSCVYWGPKDERFEPHFDDLPREDGYVTNGYTPEFVSWVNDRVYSAVCLKGISKIPEIWEFVRKEA